MKKVILAMCVALAGGLCASAQKGDIAVGLNVGYGTEIKNVGIGIEGQYNITDAIRAEAGFDYFLEKDGLSMWDVNLNFHYLFNVAEKIKVYPLVGITYTNWKFNWEGAVDDAWDAYQDEYMAEVDRQYNEMLQEYGKEYADMFKSEALKAYEQEKDKVKSANDAYDESAGKFGVNVGAGVQYELMQNLVINLEGKYQIISDFNQAVFNVGVAYKF